MHIDYYRIIENPTYTNNVEIGLEIYPENEPLKFFISSIDIGSYPELIDNVAKSKGYSGEYWHYRPYTTMDLEDIAYAEGIKENEVYIIHDIIGNTVINELQFCKILLEYAIALLKAYSKEQKVQKKYTCFLNNKLLPNSWDKILFTKYDKIWSLEMIQMIERLKIKINDLQAK